MKNKTKPRSKLKTQKKKERKGKKSVHKEMILIYKKKNQTEEEVSALWFLIRIRFIIKVR
jgi:hypothetical protein